MYYYINRIPQLNEPGFKVFLVLQYNLLQTKHKKVNTMQIGHSIFSSDSKKSTPQNAEISYNLSNSLVLYFINLLWI